MTWITCPACGQGEFDMRCIGGPEPDVNAGPEYEVDGQYGCECKLTAEQEEALHCKAAESHGEDFPDEF